MRFLSSSAELEKIGVILLDQSPPGPVHRVETDTVLKLKVSIVSDKDRIPVMELLSCTSSSWTKSVAQRPNWQRATRENMGHIRPGSNTARRDAPPGHCVANYCDGTLGPTPRRGLHAGALAATR